MKWNVKNFNCNQNVIEDYDIFYGKYWMEIIKKLKKTCNTREEFVKTMKTKLMSQYWSRCEYEVIIKRENDRIYLAPWVGSRDPEAACLDVTDDKSFDWAGFAEKNINRQIFKTEAKVDVWDQLEYRWDEFVNYCLTAKIPYDRNARKFVEQ